jgi:hypothetical protein
VIDLAAKDEGVLLAALLLLALVIVSESIRHPTRTSKITVRGTHVDVEPIREAVG